jgi:hypothetical protein
VADMCKSSSATEETSSGGDKVTKTDNDITIALIMACYPYLFDNDI